MKPLPAQNSDLRSREFAVAVPPRSRHQDAGRAALTTLAVLAGTALALRAGDAIPGWFSGVPRGVYVCANLDEAEVRTGLPLGNVRMGLPGYGAQVIRATTRPVPALAIAAQESDGKTQLTFFHSHGGPIPSTLRPPLPSFHEIAVPLRPGLLASLKAERQGDGSVWQDLEWSNGPEHTAVRFNGRTMDLLRLARQLVQNNDDHENKP